MISATSKELSGGRLIEPPSDPVQQLAARRVLKAARDQQEAQTLLEMLGLPALAP